MTNTITFNLDELAIMSLYNAQRSRVKVVSGMTEALSLVKDESLAELMRGCIAKLSLISDKQFAEIDFDEAEDAFD